MLVGLHAAPTPEYLPLHHGHLRSKVSAHQLDSMSPLLTAWLHHDLEQFTVLLEDAHRHETRSLSPHSKTTQTHAAFIMVPFPANEPRRACHGTHPPTPTPNLPSVYDSLRSIFDVWLWERKTVTIAFPTGQIMRVFPNLHSGVLFHIKKDRCAPTAICMVH